MRTIVPSVRTLVLILSISFFCNSSKAQSISTGNGKFEVGLGIGPMFFLGDLGGNPGVGQSTWLKDVEFPLTKLSVGLHANYYPTEFLGFRAAVNHGSVHAYDAEIVDKGGAERFRKDRNLQFRSQIWEAYVAAEFYPTVFFERYDGLQGKFRPYGVIGIGGFHFNPKGEYFTPDGRSTWVDLQPLRTEGQGMAEYSDRKPYSLFQMEIPMGAGFKYYVKENMFVGLEVLHRQTFTDYIDDVSTNYIDPSHFANYLSPQQTAMANQLYYRQNFVPNGTASRPALGEQRGDVTQNDAFFSTVIRCGFRLNDSNSPNGRASRMMRCPVFY